MGQARLDNQRERSRFLFTASPTIQLLCIQRINQPRVIMLGRVDARAHRMRVHPRASTGFNQLFERSETPLCRILTDDDGCENGVMSSGALQSMTTPRLKASAITPGLAFNKKCLQ